MEFFYPNFTNDFWRIQGLIHFGDPKYFEVRTEDGSKPVRFDRDRIVGFCMEKGLAFFDTARKICRTPAMSSWKSWSPPTCPGCLRSCRIAIQ